MSGLEQTFYIVGITFMVIMLFLIFGLVISVVVIKSKVDRIHDQIDRKLQSVTNIAEKGGELAAMARSKKTKNAKKVGRKKK